MLGFLSVADSYYFFISPGGLFAMFGERFLPKGKPVGTPPERGCVNGHCVLFRTCEDRLYSIIRNVLVRVKVLKGK